MRSENSANYHVCVRAKSPQLCLTLWDPMDGSPPDLSLHGILQARILEWVALLFLRGSSWPRNRNHVSYVSCIGGQASCSNVKDSGKGALLCVELQEHEDWEGRGWGRHSQEAAPLQGRQCAGLTADFQPRTREYWSVPEHWSFQENWSKTQSLCTSAESNLRNRVLGEIEKQSFIALSGKGGHSRPLP